MTIDIYNIYKPDFCSLLKRLPRSTSSFGVLSFAGINTAKAQKMF